MGKKVWLFQKVDDSLGVFHTHAVAGFMGGFLVGIFATAEGSAAFAAVSPGGAEMGNGVQIGWQIVGAIFIILSQPDHDSSHPLLYQNTSSASLSVCPMRFSQLEMMPSMARKPMALSILYHIRLQAESSVTLRWVFFLAEVRRLLRW